MKPHPYNSLRLSFIYSFILSFIKLTGLSALANVCLAANCRVIGSGSLQTIVESRKEKYNELSELKLWEGSTVTWGANKDALVTGVKSMNKQDLFTKMNSVLKAIKNGKYENEEIFDILDLYFKQLQQQIIDLSTQPETLVSPDPPTIKKADYLMLSTSLENQLLKFQSN